MITNAMMNQLRPFQMKFQSPSLKLLAQDDLACDANNKFTNVA